MERFMDPRVDSRLRHAYAMLFKTVAVGHTLSWAQTLSEEIGWRELLEDNQLIRIEVRKYLTFHCPSLHARLRAFARVIDWIGRLLTIRSSS
jgi:hypothetical protein